LKINDLSRATFSIKGTFLALDRNFLGAKLNLYFYSMQFPIRDALPPDLRIKQRVCVRRHNLRVFGLYVLMMLCLTLSFCEIFSDNIIGFCLFAAAIVVVIYFIATMPRADAKFSRRIGFVCPFCNEPLYFASSVGQYSCLITNGECPHCHKLLISQKSS
jgi:hypothetical protein